MGTVVVPSDRKSSVDSTLRESLPSGTGLPLQMRSFSSQRLASPCGLPGQGIGFLKPPVQKGWRLGSWPRWKTQPHLVENQTEVTEDVTSRVGWRGPAAPPPSLQQAVSHVW